MTYSEIITRTKDDDSNILNAFHYGSFVYGTSTDKSDEDYIFVVRNKTREEFSDNKIDVHYLSQDEYTEKLLSHEIQLLECYFLTPNLILKETFRPTLKLDPVKLRHSLSAKASNSFVKAKKKLTVEADYDLYIGRKSLWHSLRILMFGIQIGKASKIYDYTEANHLYNGIFSCYDWQTMFETYKSLYNKLATEFRTFAPKQ